MTTLFYRHPNATVSIMSMFYTCQQKQHYLIMCIVVRRNEFYFLLQTLRISCKRAEYNCYEGQTYSKFENIPLASKGWHHRKSRGDFFTIQKYREASKNSFEKIHTCLHILFMLNTSLVCFVCQL